MVVERQAALHEDLDLGDDKHEVGRQQMRYVLPGQGEVDEKPNDQVASEQTEEDVSVLFRRQDAVRLQDDDDRVEHDDRRPGGGHSQAVVDQDPGLPDVPIRPDPVEDVEVFAQRAHRQRQRHVAADGRRQHAQRGVPKVGRRRPEEQPNKNASLSDGHQDEHDGWHDGHVMIDVRSPGLAADQLQPVECPAELRYVRYDPHDEDPLRVVELQLVPLVLVRAP
ncbi:hypothetical protein LSH36_632g01006 [Paralvinella palmiformis]|uniref:Uncharacterized protein n=1 Tax=Paralvinella palmiformis TaxID=53620 RepID=A0AAD9J491_9ANNE|nr:hypothetical protein LSH36_632g01006 [Paralvinella palmiformis]